MSILREQLVARVIALAEYLQDHPAPGGYPFLTAIDDDLPCLVHEPHHDQWTMTITLPDPGPGVPRVSDIRISCSIPPHVEP